VGFYALVDYSKVNLVIIDEVFDPCEWMPIEINRIYDGSSSHF
jgi:hypothetical protein